MSNGKAENDEWRGHLICHVQSRIRKLHRALESFSTGNESLKVPLFIFDLNFLFQKCRESYKTEKGLTNEYSGDEVTTFSK